MTEDEANIALASGKEQALAAYNQIVESAELFDIRLMDFNFSTKPEYFVALDAEAEGAKRLTRSFEFNLIDMNLNIETNILGGHFSWSTYAASGKKKLLKVEAKYFIVYGGVPDVGTAHIEAYLGKVGRFATYPYFRSLVSHMSWESKADLPVMPVLKR